MHEKINNCIVLATPDFNISIRKIGKWFRAVKIFDMYYFCTFARNFSEIISPKKSIGFVTIDKDDNKLFIMDNLSYSAVIWSELNIFNILLKQDINLLDLVLEELST